MKNKTDEKKEFTGSYQCYCDTNKKLGYGKCGFCVLRECEDIRKQAQQELWNNYHREFRNFKCKLCDKFGCSDIKVHSGEFQAYFVKKFGLE